MCVQTLLHGTQATSNHSYFKQFLLANLDWKALLHGRLDLYWQPEILYVPQTFTGGFAQADLSGPIYVSKHRFLIQDLGRFQKL